MVKGLEKYSSGTDKVADGARVTLALGGGAALGWAHIGVLRAFSDFGFQIGAVAGTSIGALVGGTYLAGHLDALEEIARSASILKILSFLDLQLHGRGLLDGDSVVRELNKFMSGVRIEELPLPYAAVAADLIAGEQVVFREGLLVEAIRASISIPGVFTPLQLGGQFLVDGGMVNPLPVSVARVLSNDPVVAIDITGDYQGQTASLRAKPGGASDNQGEPAYQAFIPKALASSIAGRFFNRNSDAVGADAPNLVATMAASFALHVRHMTRAQLGVAPADVRIIPSIGHISMMDFNRAGELIDAGYAAIEAEAPRLRALLHDSREFVSHDGC